MEKSKELLTISEACRLLKCHPNTLRKWDTAGILTSLRMGERGHRRYKREDIDNFLQNSSLLKKTRRIPLGDQNEAGLASRTPEDLKALLMALSETALVSETNRRGDITYANNKFAEVSKFELSEIIGKNHRILKSGYHSHDFYRDMWRTISKGRVWRGKIKNKAKDGTFYWVDTSIAPIVDENGRPVRYISVRFPITEQMELQEKLENLNTDLEDKIKERTHELHESENKLRDLTNSMLQLVWTADPNGIVDYYNDKVNNYDLSEISENGFNWLPFIHPEDVSKTIEAWETALKEHRNYEIEHRIKMKNGKFSWHLTRAVAAKDATGEIVKWYGTSTDIHKHKQLEHQKDNFLGVASHELKTPVTSIKAYNHVLKSIFNKKGENTAVEILNKMDVQINRLTVLIGDLLDVTKIQSGKLNLRYSDFDFNELVKEISSEMQVTTDKHQIKTELGDTRTVHGDRERIGQVITNFLSNSIKYSPNSNDIIVRTNSTSHEVTLCVRDFGLGIPIETKEKVFERFFRVEGTQQDTFPGLGLGLYIASEIVNRHNGKIWVESEEGKGSTFCFNIPVQGKPENELEYA